MQYDPYNAPPMTPPPKPVADADNLTIAAFVLAFIVPLVGLIMGVVSRRQAKRAGLKPNALSTWAIWLGGVFTTISVIIVVAIIASVGAAVNQATTPYSQPVSAPVPATSSSSGAVFYADVQNQFPDLAAGAGAHGSQIIELGHTLCSKRAEGIDQATLVRAVSKDFAQYGDPQSFVRLAETDLCPAYLVPVMTIKPPKAHVLATFSGSGTQRTGRFTIAGSGDWVLRWTYDCSGFSSTGNFIVDEDGGANFDGVSVNELGAGGHGKTHAYGDSGRHYLSVISECDWTVKVVQ